MEILESVFLKPVMKKIITIAICAFAVFTFAHTHNNATLTRETKIIAITILAEARGEGQGGMYAVAAVIAIGKAVAARKVGDPETASVTS